MFASYPNYLISSVLFWRMSTGSNLRPFNKIGYKTVTSKDCVTRKGICSLHILGSYIISVNIGMIMRAKVFTSYISTWILYVKGISLAPWQHMMSRLLPATLLLQGYFRQHQGSKPFKDLRQKQILKWLWLEQIY